jgi:hypothetical protein
MSGGSSPICPRIIGLLGGAAVAGDEPLQTHVWPMAKTFLNRAIASNVPTALITNGYNLVDFIEELRSLKKTKIVVSLDAASDKHDEIRRKTGAFARISEGLRSAARYPDLRERLSIATILMPGTLTDVRDLIAFTASHRIPQLLISPLLTSSRTTPLTVHPRILRDAWRDLPALRAVADAAGIKLRVSDEFAMLGPWEEKLASTGIEILSPKEPARLIRIDAAGRVETLASMQAGITTGIQVPSEVYQIDAFVDALLDRCFEPIEVAA